MVGKKKTNAILAILIVTVSILVMIPIPIPVSAQPANAKIYLSNFLWKYPNGTKLYDQIIPYLFGQPVAIFNKTLNYPENASLLGAFPVLAVIVENTTVGGFNMSSWEFGCKWNSEAFDYFGFWVTFYFRGNESVPAIPAKTIFEDAYTAGNANQTVGTINKMNGTVVGYKMAITDGSSVLVTRPRVMCYIIPTVAGYGETLLDIASYVKIDDQGNDITPATIINGYFKFRIHEVKIFPTVWINPPHTIGSTFTLPITMQTTEHVHSWELNMSYYGVTELGAPTTPNILCEGTANVTEGHFLLLSNKTDPHGGNTFSVQVGPGWIWANGTYNVASQYAYSWLGATLMVINFNVTAYGTTMLNITSFSATNTTATEITPPTNVNLALGLRINYFSFQKRISIVPIFEAVSNFLMNWTHPPRNIGETFIVDVNIEDTSQNVHSWQSGFHFNPAVLQCLNVTEGDYLSSQGSTTWNPNIVIDNTSGAVYNLTCTGDPGVYNTGGGTLYKIGFNVTGYGRSLISFTQTNGDPCETKILDNAGNEIVSTPYGGIALISGVFEFRAPITVNLRIGSTNKKESYIVGEIFTVQIMINSIENMRSWQSGFYFYFVNKGFLNCTGVTFGDVFAGANYNFSIIDNVNGYVSVSQTFLAPNYAAGGVGLLANITFQVIANGHTYLDLTDKPDDPTQTVITDLDGEPRTLNSLVDLPWGHSAIVWRKGDVDGSGAVNIADMLILKIKLSGQPSVAGYIYDVNYDGGVNPGDMLQLKIILSG